MALKKLVQTSNAFNNIAQDGKEWIKYNKLTNMVVVIGVDCE